MDLVASGAVDMETLPRLFNFLKSKVSLNELEAELRKDPSLLDDINIPTSRKGTPLLYCTVSKSLTKAQLLLSLGADPNIPSTLTKYNYFTPITPIFIACGAGFLSLAQILLENGAELTAKLEDEIGGVVSLDLLGYSFYRMYRHGDPIPVVSWIVKNAKKQGVLDQFNFNLHLPEAINKSLLGIACYAKFWATAYLLLECGADPNEPDKDGWTPLHSACRADNGPEALLLMMYGADDTLRTYDEEAWMPSEKANPYTNKYVTNGAVYQRYLKKNT